MKKLTLITLTGILAFASTPTFADHQEIPTNTAEEPCDECMCMEFGEENNTDNSKD